ncbi:MAG: ribosome recycling factor [Planctomycetaceae bacterium]|jgi:ribosome recycling factor|nr:ribosome recycling factor [Planctomycetaceae bacterium]MBT6155914.1 ribosome recycling factor [Planctomycetaceae bacterium]MBT6483171.1 ribosome recycling factor [Planctomycetaceae bacterium]MBT6495175.1 ribosome recycling factor [Planctomycetaceae bacterium]
MDRDEILLDAEERMDKACEVYRDQLLGLRTGRATPGLVDSLRVDCYGSPTPLKQMANISVPEPQQIVIKPFDPSTIGNISKAIQASDLGLSPNSDGRLIRLNIPPLSTDRRKQLAGRVKELAEEARISIRNIRRDANKHADQTEKAKGMSKDECADCKDDIQKLTKQHEGKVNDMASTKEKDVMGE